MEVSCICGIAFIQGEDRNQATLLPQLLDDYVADRRGGAASLIDYAVLDSIMTDKADQTQLLRDFLQHIRTDRSKLGE